MRLIDETPAWESLKKKKTRNYRNTAIISEIYRIKFYA